MDNSTQNIYNSDEDLKKRMNKLYFIYGGIVLVIIIVGAIIFLAFKSQSPSSSNQQQVISPTTSASFINPTPTTLPIPVQLTQAAGQSQADQNYGKAQQQVVQNYPWYNKLPLQASNYFVYFNLTTKTISAELYTSDPTKDTQLKSSITSQLQGLGVDLNTYPIVWKIDSQSSSQTDAQ